MIIYYKIINDKKGITLISLVITIIVLLILTGVMVSLIMGENGVIAKAMLAREKATEADVLEDIRLKILEIRAENDGQATLEQLVIKLQADGRYEYIVMKTSKYASLSLDGDIRSDNLVDTEISDYLKKEDSVIYVTRNNIEVQVTNEMVPQIREKGILAVKTHILSFDANIQSLRVPRPKMLQEGQEETIDCTEEIPQREGFEFLGWSTKENPQEADLEYTAENNTFEMEDTDVTLYAVWKEIDKTQSVEGVAIIESIPETLTMTVGETKNLSAMLTPSTATNPNITWNSSDTSKATIDGNGLLTAVAAGTSTITVTTEDGNKTDTCTVTIAAVQQEKKLKKVSATIWIDEEGHYYANKTKYDNDQITDITFTDSEYNSGKYKTFTASSNNWYYDPYFWFDAWDTGLTEIVGYGARCWDIYYYSKYNTTTHGPIQDDYIYYHRDNQNMGNVYYGDYLGNGYDYSVGTISRSPGVQFKANANTDKTGHNLTYFGVSNNKNANGTYELTPYFSHWIQQPEDPEKNFGYSWQLCLVAMPGTQISLYAIGY